jgi:predicted  nucleic acid-binding Zn ribbon protein
MALYVQEVSIALNPEISSEAQVDAFSLLHSFYRGSGQTLGRIESQYIDHEKIVCYPHTHEAHSLSPEFDNYYVRRQRATLESLCAAPLQIRLAGKLYETEEGTCQCNASPFYILITSYITIYSPVVCGSCNQPVPLYRLPRYNDHGYMHILSWETNYKACDDLQMNGEVGERWALKQMQDPASPLSRQGRAICRNLEKLTGIPTYYYLHNYKYLRGDQRKIPCPVCKQPWDLSTSLHNRYDFRCDTCFLVSVISPNC